MSGDNFQQFGSTSQVPISSDEMAAVFARSIIQAQRTAKDSFTNHAMKYRNKKHLQRFSIPKYSVVSVKLSIPVSVSEEHNILATLESLEGKSILETTTMHLTFNTSGVNYKLDQAKNVKSKF
jgi:hypothetical protein